MSLHLVRISLKFVIFIPPLAYIQNHMQGPACVYILTNRSNSVLYDWVINTLNARLCEYRASQTPNSFTSRSDVSQAYYYEELDPKKK